MDGTILDAALSQGIWAVLAVFLLLYVVKENEKRVNTQEELVKFTHNKNKNLEKEFSQTIIIPMVK